MTSVSEDKKKERPAESTWQERKQETIDGLKTASRDTKLLCLGDKLSNLREMSRDYKEIGDELWERFNQKDKAVHAWYYKSIYQILVEEFRELEEIQEFGELLEIVF